MGVEDHLDVLCLWDVEAGQELGSVVDVLDGVTGDPDLVHHGSELVRAGEAGQIQILGVGHTQVAGELTVPGEQGVGEVDRLKGFTCPMGLHDAHGST